MSEPENEYVHHAKKATELLKRSVDLHNREQAGELTYSEAIDRVIPLNEEAAAEMEKALGSLKDELDPG